MNSTTLLEWQLAGWLGLTPAVFWPTVAAAAVACVLLTAALYRAAMQPLTAAQRIAFVAMRSGVFLCLLLCLAGPARTERVVPSSKDTRTLAVVVDRSPSMSIAEQPGSTRLSGAVSAWRKVEPAALKAFSAVRYYQFAAALGNAGSLDDALSSSEGGKETHLYDALNQVLDKAPSGGFGGIVCLTDGLDTTGSSAATLSARARRERTPLYFVAGQSRDTPLEDLVIRELDVPGRVLRKSRFEAMVIIEAHALREHDVRVSLSVNGTETSSATLHLRQGMNLIPWTTTAESGEPGPLELKVRAGGGSSSESFEAVVPVVELERIRILVYQGSIDWTSRFIKDAVRDDHTFSVLCYFSPRLKLSADPYKTSPGFSQVMIMPDSSQALSENIDVVVLANLVASDLTTAQQSAFLAFVQGGGRLLLIEPDTEMASSFSGSPFEQMSPVVFRMPSAQPESAESVDEFERRMKSTEDNPGSGAGSPGQPLLNFALPEGTAGSRISELFGSAAGSAPGILPKFSTFAKIRGIKPGAQVLAVHPTEKTDSNDPYPLLVSERYGSGYVAALLTDGLWRWKLAVPSSSHDPEIFWQQLFRTLANREIDHAGMRFSLRPLRASMGLACNFRIEGAQGLGPTITAVSPSGRSLPVYPQLDEASGSWTFQVTPDEEGRWAVSAVDGRGAKIGASVLVANPRHGEEFSGLPADNEGLRALADSTGGAMINKGVPRSWQLGDAEKAPAPIAVRRSQLWDNWPLLLAAVGLYAAELIWRRRRKLL